MDSQNILKCLLLVAVCVFLMPEVVTTSSFSRKLQTSISSHKPRKEEDLYNLLGMVRDIRTSIFQLK